jgi:dienelactone hydrolase
VTRRHAPRGIRLQGSGFRKEQETQDFQSMNSTLLRRLHLILTGFIVNLLLVASAPAGGYEAIEIVQTRPDVTVRLLVIKANSKPSTALILFPGADGAKHFGEKDGRFWVSNNFLMRSARDLAAAGYLVVAVDAPSDQSCGMSDQFRTSPQHAKDIRKIMAYLREKHRMASLYLVGTSKGSISAAYLASVFDDPSIGGVILTAVYPPSECAGINFSEIDDPVLILHHLYDECRATPIQGAFDLKKKLTETPQVDLVVVTGGSLSASTPCNALSNHGFFGVEKPVLRVITDWLAGKPVPERIGK